MKTTLKLLRPEDVWQPKMGAPRGNRNAFKTGVHVKEARTLRTRVTSVRRTMKRLMEAAKEELAMRPAAR